jgi:putative Ca2+/H+ antiporter (TMEM165/GDT1 family)
VDPDLVASSFALLFLAEMGDKTQLMAMTLATRYRPLPVALGACGAFLVLNLLAVLFGGLLFRHVPERPLLVAAGLLFLGFAWNAWRNADDHDEATVDPAARAAPRGGGRVRGVRRAGVVAGALNAPQAAE